MVLILQALLPLALLSQDLTMQQIWEETILVEEVHRDRPSSKPTIHLLLMTPPMRMPNFEVVLLIYSLPCILSLNSPFHLLNHQPSTHQAHPEVHLDFLLKLRRKILYDPEDPFIPPLNPINPLYRRYLSMHSYFV